MNKKILLVLIICFSVFGLVMTLTINPKEKFNQLNISEEEWNSIVSARKEGSLSLVNLKFNDYDLIIDEIHNKLYYSVIHNSQSKFTPMVSFKASSASAKMVILNDEITEDKIQNNHEFKVMIYDDSMYKIYGLYCTSFPMVNIVYNQQETTNTVNIPMSMYLFNNFDNSINRMARSEGTISRIEMEDGTYNFTFSLVMTTTGNKERENVISLLNMRPSNEYFLNAINTSENNSPIKDNMKQLVKPKEKPGNFSGDNLMRMSENMRGFSGEPPVDRREKPDDFWEDKKMAIENNTQRIELFINNEYIGLYSLSYDPDVRVRPRNR